MVSECDVEDGELPPRLVDYPPAGHNSDLADAGCCCGKEPGCLPAYQMAARTQGHSQVVIVDGCGSFGVRDKVTLSDRPWVVPG